MSQGSFSDKSDAEISFAASITEPPPTASTKSLPCARPTAIASLQVSTLGLLSIPQNSFVSYSLSAFVTFSYTPLRFTLPPPKSRSTFVPVGISLLSVLIESFPKMSFVGFLKLKFCMT